MPELIAKAIAGGTEGVIQMPVNHCIQSSKAA
jgi:hypothetical protein